MHELSLCRRIFAIADRARGGRTVETVHVQIGQLRQVVPTTLAHCWRLLTVETVLDGAGLEIEHVPVELRCKACGALSTDSDLLALACGNCGSRQVAIERGEELNVTAIEVRVPETVHG